MEIELNAWRTIEYEAFRLQAFYVWHLNDNEDGNETNSLTSYSAYHTLNTKTVEPNITHPEVAYVIYLIDTINQNNLHHVDGKKIKVSSKAWHKLEGNVLEFVSIYLHDPKGSKITPNLVSRDVLNTDTTLCMKIAKQYDKNHQDHKLESDVNDLLGYALDCKKPTKLEV